MKHLFSFIILSVIISGKGYTQNVGIGTSTPLAGLHIVSNNGVIVKGDINTGTVINEVGAGSRFIFNPRKSGAIRAGYLNLTGANFWDDASTGDGSIAFGYNAKASGNNSVALGQFTVSSGLNSTAIGYGTEATAPNAIAFGGVSSYANSQFAVAVGNNVNANNFGSVAIGRNINSGYPFAGYGQNTYAFGIGDNTNFSVGGHYATGHRSFVFGNNDRSVGDRSFAIGNDCAAGQFFENSLFGRYSFAIGNSCSSTGIYSFAIGNNAYTNGKQGSMVLSSRIDGVSVSSPADFHFLAQFAGGYQLQSNNAGTLGVYLNPSTSSWSSLCDSTKKEQVLLMNDDEVLEKLAAINYTSWKYRDDPEVTNRHYGIMAQDFYAAFGKDDLGKIGNDTLVNPIDLIGVAYSAIKALEKRTSEMEVLKNDNEMLKARLNIMEKSMVKRRIKK